MRRNRLLLNFRQILLIILMAVMGLTFVLGFSWLNVQAATESDSDDNLSTKITFDKTTNKLELPGVYGGKIVTSFDSDTLSQNQLSQLDNLKTGDEIVVDFKSQQTLNDSDGNTFYLTIVKPETDKSSNDNVSSNEDAITLKKDKSGDLVTTDDNAYVEVTLGYFTHINFFYATSKKLIYTETYHIKGLVANTPVNQILTGLDVDSVDEFVGYDFSGLESDGFAVTGPESLDKIDFNNLQVSVPREYVDITENYTVDGKLYSTAEFKEPMVDLMDGEVTLKNPKSPESEFGDKIKLDDEIKTKLGTVTSAFSISGTGIDTSEKNPSLSDIISFEFFALKKEDTYIAIQDAAKFSKSPLEVTMNYTSDNKDLNWDNVEVTKMVTLQTNLGEKSVEVQGNMSMESGKVNTVSITVPEVAGYTPDKKNLTVDVASDGTMTVEDNSKDNPITYTKNVASSGSNNATTSKSKVTDKSQLVSTYVDKGDVTLYKLDGSTFSKITNHALSPATDWKSNAYLENNGERYYRVGNNEWVKAGTVYVYEPEKLTVDTKNKLTSIRNSEDKQITNRAFAKNTAWKVDRLAYLGSNNALYYRVATNMFVSVNDVTKE
ncbi:hypothetical protein FHL06_02885 [Lactobacillus halodurans]|uniref:Surface layer protein A domain-containing protein n=1 Tax=Companilactobacillus halodurans TaxID=2584183 RepID=A0A5P0ZM56_9LACO|nr:hypothetical protein [Companilactobacillus halodurans]MQS75340.1 hypothetical protein [Companilactobacillus halodurans]